MESAANRRSHAAPYADALAPYAGFVRGPKFEDVPYPVKMEPNLIMEYYSR